jgi:hypothetical protein
MQVFSFLFMGRKSKTLKRSLAALSFNKKSATIVYDAIYEGWKEKLTVNTSILENFKSIDWQTYTEVIPENNQNNNLVVLVPHHSDGENCYFSEYQSVSIQDIVLQATTKGWSRIHLHSCFTSKCFKHLNFENINNTIVFYLSTCDSSITTCKSSSK